jgi:16S rRNA (guanine(966)-N(2))-methyltransferase RsmD
MLAGKVLPGVRPTSARVREALFSIVGQDMGGLSVLDAFGGSGMLAFESLSRGAGRVTVVERHGPTAAAIRQNAKSLGVVIDLRVRDVSQLFDEEQFDLVMLDPPYGDDAEDWVLRAAVAVRHLLVVEHPRNIVLPEIVGNLAKDRTRCHGRSALTVYRPGELSGLEEMPVVSDDLAVIEDER